MWWHYKCVLIQISTTKLGHCKRCEHERCRTFGGICRNFEFHCEIMETVCWKKNIITIALKACVWWFTSKTKTKNTISAFDVDSRIPTWLATTWYVLFAAPKLANCQLTLFALLFEISFVADDLEIVHFNPSFGAISQTSHLLGTEHTPLQCSTVRFSWVLV